MAETNSLIRNPLVLAGVAVVVIGAAVGGYFLWMKPSAPKMTADGKPIPSLCEAALARVTAYGLVESDARLVSTVPSKTETANRMLCQAKSGETTYAMSVDVACDDLSKDKCLKLYSVTDSAGNSLFQRHNMFQDE